MIHWRDCPKVQAWDCGPEEGVYCQCPDGWPKTQEDWEEYQGLSSPYIVPRVEYLRPAKNLNKSRKITDKELITLSKLSSMRYWGLRQVMSGNPYSK